MDWIFRGKDLNTKEWVFGYHISTKDNAGKETCFIVHLGRDKSLIYKAVDKNTLGIYTGRGLIYQEDIVFFNIPHLDVWGRLGVVKYNNCSFYIDTIDCHYYNWCDYECVILGNIFDNKDLYEKILEE